MQKPYHVSKDGKITITKIEPDGKHISGTFEFTGRRFDPAKPYETSYDYVPVTNGSFEVNTYKVGD